MASEVMDRAFLGRGWYERAFQKKIVADQGEMESPPHQVDGYKSGVALETEWNNKDPLFDRDWNNFRLLFELRAVSVDVVVTPCGEFQERFHPLGKGSSYGASTTRMSQLLPRIEGVVEVVGQS